MLITGVWLEGVSNGGVNSRGAINRTGHAINGGVNNRGVSNGGINSRGVGNGDLSDSGVNGRGVINRMCN